MIYKSIWISTLFKDTPYTYVNGVELQLIFTSWCKHCFSHIFLDYLKIVVEKVLILKIQKTGKTH